jgi:hypothetical protein
VLLGQRRYDLSRKVAALVLRDVTAGEVPLEVLTFDGSLWRPRNISMEKEALVVDTPLAGQWRIPEAELAEMRRSPAR